MTLEPPVLLLIAGLGFRPIEDCTIARAKNLEEDRVELSVISCSDEPYLSGKTPIGVYYEVFLPSETKAWDFELPAKSNPTREVRNSAVAYAHPTATFSRANIVVIHKEHPTTAPIPLPLSAFLLATALFLIPNKRK